MRDPKVKGPGARLACGLTSQREIPASAGSHQHPASTLATPAARPPSHRAAARPRRRPPDRHFHASATSPQGHQDLHAISRQHVHPRPSLQATVLLRPCAATRVRVRCGTFLLYCFLPAEGTHPGPRRRPDQRKPCALGYRRVPSGASQIGSCSHRKTALGTPSASPHSRPRQPRQLSIPRDSPAETRHERPGLHSNFRF